MQNFDGIQEPEQQEMETSFLSTCGKFKYHVSVIDYLQRYNLSKKLERTYKIFTTSARPEEISSTDCDRYAERFIKFMKNQVFKPNNLSLLINPSEITIQRDS